MPSLKRPKSTVAQMALSSNLNALKEQRLEKIKAQTAAPKLPEWPSYGIFWKVTQNPHFQKKAKVRQRETFIKSPKKYPSLQRAKSTPKTGEDFGAQGGSKSARMAKLLQFLQGHPKPAFSVKVQRGDQGKFFKNRPKIGPR